MYQSELDGKFYEIAMSFFIEAGHTSNGEPEYVNFGSDCLVRKGDSLADLFGNLSFLFMTHQCMFFSIELLSNRGEISLIAQAIHKKIHACIEALASCCLFRFENKIMLTLMGYGDKCICSDWYSLSNYSELAEKIDIANILLNSDYAYFYSLIYSLGRYRCRFDEGKWYCQTYAENGVHNVKLIDRKDENIDEIPWEKAYKKIIQYGKEYDGTIGKSFLGTVIKHNMMFYVDNGKAYNPFGDEIQLDNDDDFFGEYETKKLISVQDRGQYEKETEQGEHDLFQPHNTRSESIWINNNTIQQTSHNCESGMNDRHIHSYISNITFPKTLDEILNVYMKDIGQYDLEEVLEGAPVSWTAPKWAKKDDVVFFMHASTARATASSLHSKLRKSCYLFDEWEEKLLDEWLLRGKQLADQFGGKIFAIGRVNDDSYYEYTDDDVHWRSRIYADIEDIWVLSNPLDISVFRSFISISTFSSITRLHSEEYERLKRMILKTNQNPPEFFVHSIM